MNALHTLVLAAITMLGIASSTSAITAETALRASDHFSLTRVTGVSEQARATHQQSTLGYGESASDASLASRAGVRQIDDAASAATTVGRRGQQVNFPNPSAPIPRNAPGTVGGREFSGHAFDRMQERGFTPSVVENAIKHGTPTPGSTPGTLQHFDPVNKFNVLTDAASGRVITVY